MKMLLGLLITSVVQVSNAGVMDVNTFYLSDVYTTTSDVKTSLISYDTSLGIDVGSKKNYFIGLAYGSLTAKSEATLTTSYTSTDTGLRFGLLFCKKNCVTSLTYNFITNVKYDDGAGNTPELRGTSLKYDLGYNIWFSDDVAMSLKFFYYSSSLSESITSTTLTKIAYKRTIMGPSVSLLWSF